MCVLSLNRGATVRLTMTVSDTSYELFKSRIRGTRSSKASFDAVALGQTIVSPYSYPKMLDTLSRYPKIYTEIVRIRERDPKKLVSLIVPSPMLPSKGIAWFSAIIKRHSEILGRFLADLSELDALIFVDKFEEADLKIKSMRAVFGESLVLTAREIKVLSALLSTKEFVKEVDQRVSSLGGCITSLFWRFESRIYSEQFSHRLFERDTKKFISRVKQVQLRNFLNYWLLGEVEEIGSYNSILSVSANSSIFDLYLAFDDLTQQNSDPESNSIFLSLPRQLRNNYYKQYFGNIADLGKDRSFERFIDDLVYHGSEVSTRKLEISQRVNNVRKDVGDYISTIFRDFMSHRFSPVGSALGLNLQRHNSQIGELSDTFVRILSSYCLTLRDVGFDVNKMEYVGSVTNGKSFDSDKSRHAQAIKLARSGKYVEAKDIIDVSLSYDDVVKSILVYQILEGNQDLQRLALFTSELLLKDVSYSYVLPLARSFSGRWRKFEEIEDKLSLTMCFYAVHISTPSRASLRNLRYSWKDALRHLGVEKPSEIQIDQATDEISKIIFFLVHTCTIEVMETHGAFEKTKDVEVEIGKVYANLSKYDVEREDVYRQQILAITTKHKVEEAIKQMDRSRIFVDVGMLMTWAENNLSDSLNQFKAVVNQEYSNAMDALQVYSDMISTTPDAEEEKSIVVLVASQESNHILVNIIDELRSNYLNNNDYGLDAYLSMRVRHGSFSGHLRSPLQNHNLIAYLDEDNSYSFLPLWLNESDAKAVSAVHDVMFNFSNKFDMLMDDFIKNRLRIRSEEKPSGFFYIDLLDEDLKRIKATARESERMVTVVVETSLIFKEKINKCLDDARLYILNELQPQVMSLLHGVRTDISKLIHVENSNEFLNLCESAVRDMNLAFNRVIEWFDFNIGFEKNSDFTFREYVGLFIESARYSHVDFSPTFEVNIDFEENDIIDNFDELTIYRLNDIIFTLTDNAYKYCLTVEPKLKLEFSLLNANILELSFISPVSELVDRAKIEERTAQVIETITNGESLPETKREGRSGLIKIANTARLTGGDLISAGLSEEKTDYIVRLQLGVRHESSAR